MSKSICCISSKKEWQECLQLCNLVKEKTGINISVLTSVESTVEYDTVIYIHSKIAMEDSQIAKWLKEASDLNKTFIPVIIGGNAISNRYLIYKYKGPNLRANFVQLTSDKQRFEFLDRLAAVAGVCLNGDIIGASVTLLSDADAKVFRGEDCLAELKANTPTTINLYVGIHSLDFKYIHKDNCTYTCHKTIEITDVHASQSIKVSFYKKFYLQSDINCHIYQDEQHLGNVHQGIASEFDLLMGKTKVYFVSAQEPGRKIEKDVEFDNSSEENVLNRISATFLSKVRMYCDIDCNVFQNNKQVGSLKAREYKEIMLLKGKCTLSFTSINDNNRTKTIETNVLEHDNKPIEIRFNLNLKHSVESRIPDIIRLYREGKTFSARKIIVDAYGCTYDKAEEMINSILGVQPVTTPHVEISRNTMNSSERYIATNLANIRELFLEGKTYAAAQFFKDAYDCSWDEAKRRLQNQFSGIRMTKPQTAISYPRNIESNRSHIIELYRAGKMFAAKSYFREAYNCSWLEAQNKLNEFIRNNA